MHWTIDAEVESTPLSTTGGHTWEAARRLAAYLSAAADQLGLQRPGLRLVELGSGTGWLGVNVARNMPEAAAVVLTEQPDGLAHLRRNVALNAARGLPVGHVQVQSCDWRAYGPDAAGGSIGVGVDGSSSGGGGGSAAHGVQAAPALQTDGWQSQPAAAPAAAAIQGLTDSAAAMAAHAGCAAEGQQQEAEALNLASVPWDFIIGSDLIYNEIGSRCLPRVLAALARPHTQILYCHTKHRFDLLDMEFLEQLTACGLCCEEVWEPGTPPPPESPPLRFPPTDLFPEQRIAVYRITHAQHQDN